MAGTYNITEQVMAYKEVPTPVGKFCAIVSFNGNAAEYYEVESLDHATIAETLQKVADDAQALADAAAVTPEAVQIVGGQIVV